MVEEKKVKAKVIETGKILLVENIKKTTFICIWKKIPNQTAAAIVQQL